ncbi:hypothetical protein HDU85_001815 [Gaertneriomyces sp. JEL0708]|nr:hypothetical protein HDU85_001815 [Gaertneriomyces sp. JEL0708]
MVPSRLFMQVATVTILPIVGALFAQCLVAGLATGYNWQLELIVIVAVTWGFGVQCVVLNTARFKIYKYLNAIKPFMMPIQQAKERRMMRKLNSLRLFTYLGILNMGASAVRLWVLSAKRVSLNHPISATITKNDTVIIISMGFIELLFVGFSAAAAADLFQVGHFTATSPFKKQLQMTNEKMVGIAQGGVAVCGMAQAITGAHASDKSSSGAAQSFPKAPGTASAIEGELRIIQENEEWIRSMVQTAEEQAMWWKRLGTITLKEFMTFPNPISEAEIRIWMFCVCIICCVAVPMDIYYGSPVLYWVTFYLVFTRSLFGVRLDPLAYIIIWYVKPLIVTRWGLMEDLLVAGPPRRQAMINPVPPLFVMSILWHCGWPYGSRWLSGALAATTLAQGLYDVCLGCAVFWLMIKTGIATQAACDVCTLNYEFVVERYCLSRPALSKSGSTVTSPKLDEGSKQQPSLPRKGPNVVAPSVPNTPPQLHFTEQGLNGAC